MKNKILFTILLLFNCYIGLCQDTSFVKYQVFIDDSISIFKNEDSKNEFRNDSLENVLFDDTEFCIKFHGGDKALRKYIKKNLQFHKEDCKIGGKVLASFKVNEKGKVEDVKIEKGLNEKIDKEVLRVISEMPNWKWDCKEKPKRLISIKRYIPILIKTTNVR